MLCFGVTGGWGQKKTSPGVLSSRQAAISSSLNTNLILILLRTFPCVIELDLVGFKGAPWQATKS